MSILSSARDTLATLSLERRLGAVRDAQLRDMLAGRPMDEEALRAAEREAALSTARDLYNDETVARMGIAQPSQPRDHRQDYAQRDTAGVDMAILLTHQALCRIPIVGDPVWVP